MNSDLIRRKHEVFVYCHKDGTKSSYYLKDGERSILPERISYDEKSFFNIKSKGRALTEIRKGQVMGYFKKNEEAYYKKHKPYRVFSTVWQANNCPSFIGYGDIGLSNKEGNIESSNDLFILVKPCDDLLEIHLFRTLIESKDDVLSYLDRYIKEQAFVRAC